LEFLWIRHRHHQAMTMTLLLWSVKGTYFDAYVMIDIFSRYIVGCVVHVTESAVLAKEMMEEVFTIHGIPQVVHADRGTSMTSKSVADYSLSWGSSGRIHDLGSATTTPFRRPGSKP
jgi:transposase InsO family protein